MGNVLVDSRPRIAEFTADGSQIRVASEIGGTVSVLDVACLNVVKSIAVGRFPLDLTVSKD